MTSIIQYYFVLFALAGSGALSTWMAVDLIREDWRYRSKDVERCTIIVTLVAAIIDMAFIMFATHWGWS